MNIWTVYYDPSDYPLLWVLRRWELRPDDKEDSFGPTEEVYVENTLPKLRAHLPYGMVRLPRKPDDDPGIVEVWL